MSFSYQINLPTVLTLIRLFLSPIVLPFCLVYLLPYNNFKVNLFLVIFFIFLSFTDFLDGYLARKYKVETKLGKMLDPIADKFLVLSALISLLAVNKIYFFWVIILIGRELFIMSLRQLLLEQQIFINVSLWGKLKTAAQMLMISFVILNPYQGIVSPWNLIQQILIYFSVFLSIFSAYLYLKKSINIYLKK